jgi:hypothetical protein
MKGMIHLPSLQEQINFHVMVGSQLPEFLAQLAQSGREKDALSLLVAWGTHSKANSVVWEEAKGLLKEIEEHKTA